MNTITKPTILILLCVFASISPIVAQYKAIEFSTYASSFMDNNKDIKYEFRLGDPASLRNFMLGVSLPLNPKILITPKVGIAHTTERYYNESNSITELNSEIARKTTKNLLYLNIGVEATYWFMPNYKGPFISSELKSAFNTSANSVSRVTTYGETYFNNLTQNVKADFSKDLHKIMPTVKIGLGYNLDLFTNLNFFCKFNVEYRSTGYYKNTKYISHLSRHFTIGMKYVFEGKTSLVKRFTKHYNENYNP